MSSDQRLTQKIALAQQRVEAGSVDETDFDDMHKGMRADELFKILIENQPQKCAKPITSSS